MKTAARYLGRVIGSKCRIFQAGATASKLVEFECVEMALDSRAMDDSR